MKKIIYLKHISRFLQHKFWTICLILCMILWSKSGFSQMPLDSIYDVPPISCGTGPQSFMDINSVAWPVTPGHPNSITWTGPIVHCGHFALYYDDLSLVTGLGFDDVTYGATRRGTYCEVLHYIETLINFNNIDTNAGDFVTIHVVSFEGASYPPYPYSNVFGFAGPTLPSGTPPRGIYDGYAFDHITTGVDPNPTQFDGTIRMNFDNGTKSGGPFTWANDSSSLTNCNIDLYSVLLHEMTHILGHVSLIGADSLTLRTYSMTGTNAFMLYDWIYLFKSKNYYMNWNFPSPGWIQLLKHDSGITKPYLDTTVGILKGNIWRDSTNQFGGYNGSNDNQPIYSGKTPLGIGTGGWNDIPTSYLSHTDLCPYSYTGRSAACPGYQEDYCMEPASFPGVPRRKWAVSEIRTLLGLVNGTKRYYLNPTTSYTINGVTPDSIIIRTNHAPYCKEQNTDGYPGTYDGIYPDYFYVYSSPPTFPNYYQKIDTAIVNSAGLNTWTYNVTTDPNIGDPDGNPVTIVPSSLYNIRGCDSAGVGHSQLVLDASHTKITFTARKDFIGLASFGFLITDGKEIGAFVSKTVQVKTGNLFTNKPNPNTPTCVGCTEIVLNGGWEEGSEVKTTPSNETDVNELYNFTSKEGNYYEGTQLADAHPLEWTSTGSAGSSGCVIEGAYKTCGTGTVPYAFGIDAYSCPNSVSHEMPLPNATTSGFTNTRYHWLRYNYNYSTIAASAPNQNSSPVNSCTPYILKFDVNFKNALQFNHTLTSITVNVGFTSSVQQPPNANVYTQSFPITIPVTDTNWHTITKQFWYCAGPLTSPGYINIESTFDYSFLDNVSLIKDPSPPAMSVTLSASPNPICPGGHSIITSTVNNPSCHIHYSWSPAASLSCNTCPDPVASPTTTTIYTVTVTDSCGFLSPASDTITIHVDPLPVITISPSSPSICLGSGVSLLASGASTYSWSPATGLSCTGCANPTASPTVTTTYTVIGTSSAGCTSKDSVTVIVNKAPTITFTDVNVSCNGNCNGSAMANPSGGLSPYTYSWSPGGQTTQTITSLCSGIYTVTVTDAHGCSATATTTITQPTTLVLTTKVKEIKCGGGKGQAKVTVTGGTPGYTYLWSPGGQTTSTAIGLTAGSYTVTVTDANGCVATASVTLTQPPALTASITSTTMTCTTDATATVTATGGTGAYTYSWTTFPVQTSATATGLTAGTYAVVVTDSSGCTISAFVTITAPAIPITITSSVGPPVILCTGTFVTLTASGATSYTWSPSTGLSSTTGSAVAAFPTTTTTYTVTGTTGNCVGKDSITVTIAANCCTSTCSTPGTLTNDSASQFYDTTRSAYGFYNVSCPIAINGLFKVNKSFTIYNCPDVEMGASAEILVEPGCTLYIFGLTPSLSRLWACEAMWQGIVVEPGGSVIVSDSSTVEDAIQAIYAQPGPSSSNITGLSGAIFNDNYQDIVVDPQPNGYNLQLDHAIFTCRADGSFSSGVLKAPYTGKITYQGVYLNGVLQGTAPTPVTVGTPGSPYDINTFNNMNFGVYAKSSDFNVYNNTFTNLDGPCKLCIKPALIGVAVYATTTMLPNTASTYRHAYVGAPPTFPIQYGNTMSQCYVGVDLNDYVDVAVLENTMSNITDQGTINLGNSGVYVEMKYSNISMNISNNRITNFITGVHLLRNYVGMQINCDNTISHNTIGVLTGGGIMSYGVIAEQSIPINMEYLYATYVDYDSITNGFYDIFMRNFFDEPVYVENNPKLHVIPSAASYANLNPKAGIELDNCFDFVQVANNPDIDATGTYISKTPIKRADSCVIGIHTFLSPAMRLLCNHIYNVGQGMRFEGNCNGQTIYRNTIATNSGEQCFDGFNLWKSAIIGQQGNAALSISPALQPMWGPVGNFVRSETYNYVSPPPLPSDLLYMYSSQYPTSNYGDPLAANFGPALNNASVDPPACPTAPPYPPSALQQQLNAFAQGTVSYPINAAQSQYLAQQYTLEQIQVDTALMTADSILQNFNSVAMSSNMGGLYQVNQQISQSNLGTATTINNGIVPANNIEQYQQIVNAIYLNTIARNIDSATNSQLHDLKFIAKLCPLEDGRAVFQARSMLNYFEHDALTFSDSCTGVIGDSPDRENENYTLPSNNEVKVYPNPANSLLTVQLNLTIGLYANLCMYNSLGELIECKQIQDGTNTIMISNLPSGIYYYRITDNAGNLIKADKQMIVH